MVEKECNMMSQLKVTKDQEDQETKEDHPCGLASCVVRATKRCARCKSIYYCSKTCSQTNWKVHKKVCKKTVEELEEANISYRMHEMPGKGLGLVATRTLEAGYILFTEEPLIIHNNEESFNTVYKSFSKLTDKSKEIVLGLYDNKKEDQKSPTVSVEESKVISIFITNRIVLCGYEDFKINKSGLYANISRINHSCAPNVSWCWVESDRTKRTKEVRVVRRIEEGEEICASYLKYDDFPKKEERRQLLLPWFSTCLCRVCGLSGRELRENEAVREELRRLHQQVQQFGMMGRMDNAMDAALQKVQLMEKIQYEVVKQVPTALMEYCLLAAALGRKGAREKEFRERARRMAAQFGAVFNLNYYDTCDKMSFYG